MLMKFKTPSLTVILSVAIIVFVSFLLVISMTLDLNNRKNELTHQSKVDIKKQISKLTRLAERVLIIDPQLLFEDISQEGTDSRVAFAGVILSSGKILFSTDFTQNNKVFKNLTSYYDEKLYKKSLSSKTVQLMIQGDSLLAYMNFSEPAENHEVRGLKKGVVVISYDLTKGQDKLFNLIFKERLAEIIVSLIIAIIFIIFLRKYVVHPIFKLEESARSIAKGHYKEELNLTGPVEIKNLTTSFNIMSKSLQNYINEIKEHVEHTETIIENVVDGIITIDKKGIVLSCNKPAKVMFGYELDEIIGFNVKKLMPEPYHSQHDDYLHHYDVTREKKIIGIGREVYGLRKNGDVFPLDLGVSEIERDNENFFIGIVRDVSEKHKIDKIKREFVSTVSHELRTPLTAMQGAIQLLSSGVFGDLPEEASSLLNMAKRNSDRLLTLINDLLDMDKMVEGKIELYIQPFNVQKLIDEAIDVNSNYAQKFKIKINKVGDLTDYNIKVDSSRFQQILSNFISNACKFSDANTDIEIGVEKIAATTIRVFVKDSGIGISEDSNPKIFQKFSQVDSSDARQKGGTGLGLAISKELGALMSGEVGFISKEGEGSIFYIDFPIA